MSKRATTLTYRVAIVEHSDGLVLRVAKMLVESSYAIVFTGAGVSTESGIPDFRGPEGLWRRVDPEKFTIDYFYENPLEVWRLVAQLAEMFKDAKPNPAHYAIAELEEMGIVKTVITQNIDGLHQKAGSKRVIELHGNSRYAVCLVCGHRIPIEEALRIVARGELPRCPRCGGVLKPDAVFFGEPLPRRELEEAFREAEKADLVLVVGSSLVVQPAAYIPLHAKETGAKIVIVNASRTAMDSIADVIVRGKAGEILPKILEKVKAIITGRD